MAEESKAHLRTANRNCGGTFQTAGINTETGSIVDVMGEDVFVPAPAQVLEIYDRQCGDFYAEIRGQGVCVSGYGRPASAAVKMAVAKVSA